MFGIYNIRRIYLKKNCITCKIIFLNGLMISYKYTYLNFKILINGVEWYSGTRQI